jgi:cytochrome c5
MTYLGRNGKQYVVVAAGGTNRFRMIANTADKNSDALIAFALSDKQDSGSSLPTNSSAGSVRATTGVAAPLPQGEGRETVIAICTKCHGPANFSTLRMSRSAWQDEVEDMKDKGAVGTEDDFKRVIDYLAKNFPPR